MLWQIHCKGVHQFRVFLPGPHVFSTSFGVFTVVVEVVAAGRRRILERTA